MLPQQLIILSCAAQLFFNQPKIYALWICFLRHKISKPNAKLQSNHDGQQSDYGTEMRYLCQ